MNNYPTLFLLTNTSHAQWYRVVAENKIELIKESEAEEYELSDHEGSFRSPNKTGAPDVMSKVKLAEEKKFLQQVANHTKEILQGDTEMHEMTYAAPEQLKNELHDILERACGLRTYQYISGNHVGASKEKIMKLMKQNTKTSDR
ncbi:MAG: hypothetical protein WCW16_01620 [Candidatus Magasanikbacteria bacterium]